MSYAQEKYLDSLGLPETSKYPEMTQGEASDLIEKWKESKSSWTTLKIFKSSMRSVPDIGKISSTGMNYIFHLG